MNVIEYDNADKFLMELLNLVAKGEVIRLKDDAFTLRIGFRENGNWHKLPLRYIKGRPDIAEKIKEALGIG